MAYLYIFGVLVLVFQHTLQTDNHISKLFEVDSTTTTPSTSTTKPRTFYDYQTRVAAYKDLIESRCLIELLSNGESQIGEKIANGSSLPKNLFISDRKLSKRQIWTLAGQRIEEFCRGFPTYLIRELKPHESINDIYVNDFPFSNVKNYDYDENLLRRRRSTRHFFVGKNRGQTQSQYLHFGQGTQQGKAEAESTFEGSKAVVTGSSGIGQAQSQSNPWGCDDCYSPGIRPDQEETVFFGKPGYPEGPDSSGKFQRPDTEARPLPAGDTGEIPRGIHRRPAYSEELDSSRKFQRPGGEARPVLVEGTGQIPGGIHRRPGYPEAPDSSGNFSKPKEEARPLPHGDTDEIPGGIQRRPSEGTGETGHPNTDGGGGSQRPGPPKRLRLDGQDHIRRPSNLGWPDRSPGAHQFVGSNGGEDISQSSEIERPSGITPEQPGKGRPSRPQGASISGGIRRPIESVDRSPGAHQFVGSNGGEDISQSSEIERPSGITPEQPGEGRPSRPQGASISGGIRRPIESVGGGGTRRPITIAEDQRRPVAEGFPSRRPPQPTSGKPVETGQYYLGPDKTGDQDHKIPTIDLSYPGEFQEQPSNFEGQFTGGYQSHLGQEGQFSGRFQGQYGTFPKGPPRRYDQYNRGTYQESSTQKSARFDSGGISGQFDTGQRGDRLHYQPKAQYTGRTNYGGEYLPSAGAPDREQYGTGQFSGKFHGTYTYGAGERYSPLAPETYTPDTYRPSIPEQYRPGGQGQYTPDYTKPQKPSVGEQDSYIPAKPQYRPDITETHGHEEPRYRPERPSEYIPNTHIPGEDRIGFKPSEALYRPVGPSISRPSQSDEVQYRPEEPRIPGPREEVYPDRYGPKQPGVAVGQERYRPEETDGYGPPGYDHYAPEYQETGRPGESLRRPGVPDTYRPSYRPGTAGQYIPSGGDVIAGRGKFTGNGHEMTEGQRVVTGGGAKVTGSTYGTEPEQYTSGRRGQIGGQGGRDQYQPRDVKPYTEGGPETQYRPSTVDQYGQQKYPPDLNIPEGAFDDSDSQVQTSVQQTNNETQASAQAEGKHAGGTAQSQVSGTYTGSGSFSASAGSDDGKRGAQTQVSGGKEGAQSSAQGRGGLGQSQAQVQLSSDTGDTISSAQTSGWNHGTQTQVVGGGKGGMADAQANGSGSTSSQAQIGFSPHDENEKDNQSTPFRGGGSAGAQSGTYAGQAQSQIQGKFQYGIKYTGGAQATSGTQNSTSNNKNFSLLGSAQNVSVYRPLNFTTYKINKSASVGTKQNSSSSSVQSHKSISVDSPVQSTTVKTEGTTIHPNDDYSDEYEEYDEATNPPSIRNIISQNSRNQRQQIILDPLEDLDATVHQSSDDFPAEGSVLQPGEFIPGSNGYQIPKGFRGRVKSMASGANTYAIGKNSHAQSVTLTPGTGRIVYSYKQPLYAVSSNTLYRNGHVGYGAGYTYQPVQYQVKSGKSLPNFVSLTKSETGSQNVYTGKKTPDVHYTQSSSCGIFTNTCVFSGTGKICFPKPKTNADGSLMGC